MTLEDLAIRLEHLDPDLPVVFRTAEADIMPGYHLTELMHADIISIDCGGRKSSRREVRMQLLDGHGGNHMRSGKLASILARSLSAIQSLGGVPVSVEFAPKNAGLSIFAIDRVEFGSSVIVTLTEAQATCRPAVEMAAAGQAQCCGPSATTSRCC